MLNLDAVKANPLRRRKVETVRRVSYRLPSTRRRVARAGSVALALGSFGLILGGHPIEALATVSGAVLLGSLGGTP